jgi:hypothetical protein
VNGEPGNRQRIIWRRRSGRLGRGRTQYWPTVDYRLDDAYNDFPYETRATEVHDWCCNFGFNEVDGLVIVDEVYRLDSLEQASACDP